MNWFGDKKKTTVIQPESSKSIAPAKALFISDYLNENRIGFFTKEHTGRHIFEKLIGSLAFADQKSAVEAIQAREAAGPTVIAPGIAMPHARMDGLSTIEAAFGIHNDDGAASDAARLYLLFLGPKKNMKLHLDFLASASSLFMSEGLCENLLQTRTPDAVMSHIRAAEKR